VRYSLLDITCFKRLLDEDTIERVVLEARCGNASVEAATQRPKTLDGEPLELGSLEVRYTGLKIVLDRRVTCLGQGLCHVAFCVSGGGVRVGCGKMLKTL